MSKEPSQEAVAVRVKEAAARANAEAQACRAAEKAQALPPDRGRAQAGTRSRYGDWERKGIISDF